MIFTENNHFSKPHFFFLIVTAGGGRKCLRQTSFEKKFSCKIQTVVFILKNNDLLGRSPHFSKPHSFFWWGQGEREGKCLRQTSFLRRNCVGNSRAWSPREAAGFQKVDTRKNSNEPARAGPARFDPPSRSWVKVSFLWRFSNKFARKLPAAKQISPLGRTAISRGRQKSQENVTPPLKSDGEGIIFIEKCDWGSDFPRKIRPGGPIS